MPVIIPPFDDEDSAARCPVCRAPGHLVKPQPAGPPGVIWYFCTNPQCPDAAQQEGPLQWYVPSEVPPY